MVAGAFNGPCHRTGHRRILVSSEGVALGVLADCYHCKLKSQSYPSGLTYQSGAITITAFIFLRESYPPVLLERKAQKLRKETGNQELRSKLASPYTPKEVFKMSIIRPLKMLCLSPIVLATSIFIAVVYGYLYLLFTTLTNVFENTYHFSSGTVGLTYLGIGLGSMLGLVLFGSVSDRIVKAKSARGEMKPEYRLPPMIPGAWCIPIGCE